MHTAISSITSPHIKRISLHLVGFDRYVDRELAGIDWRAIDRWIPPTFERLELVLRGNGWASSPSVTMALEDLLTKLLPKAVGNGILMINGPYAPDWGD